MVPLNLLLLKSKTVRESLKFPKHRGTMLLKWLWDKSRMLREVILQIKEGILSLKLFRERSNHSRLVKFPNDEGKGPIRLLCEKLSPLSKLSFPIELGIYPLKLFLEKSMVMNRHWILTNSMKNPFNTIVVKSW